MLLSLSTFYNRGYCKDLRLHLEITNKLITMDIKKRSIKNLSLVISVTVGTLNYQLGRYTYSLISFCR